MTYLTFFRTKKQTEPSGACLMRGLLALSVLYLT